MNSLRKFNFSGMGIVLGDVDDSVGAIADVSWTIFELQLSGTSTWCGTDRLNINRFNDAHGKLWAVLAALTIYDVALFLGRSVANAPALGASRISLSGSLRS